MKIIFFGGIPKQSVKDLSLDDINGTAALYSYFLRKEFDKMGIETDYCAARPGGSSQEVLDQIEIPKGDHILSVAQRGFTVRCKISKKLLENTRKSISGKITSICDHATANPTEDIIFYSVPYPKILTKNVYVGWASDHTLLYPDQDPEKIRILVDHSYYGKPNPKDITAELSRQCLDFQKRYKEKEIVIRRFSGPTGAETVTDQNWDPGIYDRTTSMPYPKACEEYRKCNIFIVTHPESLGLSVLESATCGSYIVCPFNYIKSTILSKVVNVSFRDYIPFDDIIQKLNIDCSREVTKQYTWEHISQRILKNLGE